MTASYDPLVFASVSQVFTSFCEKSQLLVLTRGADKHGSFVWEAGRQDTLARYLSFALTDEEEKEPFLAELAVGADDGARFVHRVIKSWPFAVVPSEAQNRSLLEWLDLAWDAAKRLEVGDLSEEYVTPRWDQRETSVRAQMPG